MFNTTPQYYLNFYNPLMGKYENYSRQQKAQKNKFTGAEFFKFSDKNTEQVVKELKALKGNEFISVDEYFAVINKVNSAQQTEFITLINKLSKNQDKFISTLLEFINVFLKTMSDDQAVGKVLDEEQNALKKSYIPTVIRIQKTMLGDLRSELEAAQRSRWKIFAGVPILNFIAFKQRLNRIGKFSRAMAATNILSIRLFKMFDNDKIKKEITQAYEEFADADVLEPKLKFDKYSEYIANAIRT